MSLGTPVYMSPEQAMGERDVGPASDVYSLAATLYEMLTGDPPFRGHTAQAVVAKVLTERPAPVSHLRETVPRHVSAAVHRGLARLPADRFSAAAAFADALARPGTADSGGLEAAEHAAAKAPSTARAPSHPAFVALLPMSGRALPSRRSGSGIWAKRFAREGKAAARLQQPDIVRGANLGPSTFT